MKELTRRKFLKVAAGALSGVTLSALGLGQTPLDVYAQTPDASKIALEKLLERYAPFPWKQDIIRNNPEIRNQLLEAQAKTMVESKAVTTTEKIQDLGQWSIGSGPNYTTSAVVDGKHLTFAACFYSNEVSKVNSTDGVVSRFNTGADTNPLDVAYDAKKRRIVVASADGNANLLVLDLDGNLIKKMPLAPLTGQGFSQGGAQGVTIDKNGNYWLALAYYGSLKGKGVIAKVDPDTFEVSIYKDLNINNPNGIVPSEDGSKIYSFADDGFAYEMDQEGNLLRTIETLDYGYRGAIYGDNMLVAGWLPGKWVRVNLKTGERVEFPSIPLGNSIKVDAAGLVAVAGDGPGRNGGVSISTLGGNLIGTITYGHEANGLSTIGNDIYFVTYDGKVRKITAEAAAEPLVQLAPGWDLRGLLTDRLAPYTAQSLMDELKAQGLNPGHIARWENGRWESAVPGFPGRDFPIEQGRGYFIKTNGGQWRPGARVPLSAVSTTIR